MFLTGKSLLDAEPVLRDLVALYITPIDLFLAPALLDKINRFSTRLFALSVPLRRIVALIILYAVLSSSYPIVGCVPALTITWMDLQLLRDHW
jgi:hypothetical protein